jgi:hypothetical protein
MVVIAKDVFDYDSLSRRRRVGRLHDIWAGDRRLKVAGMVAVVSLAATRCAEKKLFVCVAKGSSDGKGLDFSRKRDSLTQSSAITNETYD